jgi:hypothetical protein
MDFFDVSFEESLDEQLVMLFWMWGEIFEGFLRERRARVEF